VTQWCQRKEIALCSTEELQVDLEKAMQKESEYLAEKLSVAREERGSLPAKYDTASKQVDQRIEQLMEQAGIMPEVRRLKDELEKFRGQLQRQADVLAGQIEVMEHVFDTYHRDPVAPGTMLYGIDISKLDWQTRLMVRSNNIQTIQALGGNVAEALQPDVPEVIPPTPVTVREGPVESSVESTVVSAEEEMNYTLDELQGLVK